jgi:RNA polymerase sigma-70 factor (ECF subfamily)
MADDELLDRFAAGDTEAFSVLLKRYQRPLYNFIARSVSDMEAARDITQDAFTRVIQGAEGFNRDAKFSTWLYAIARNLCIDHSRRMKHRRHASLDAPVDSAEGKVTFLDRVVAQGPDAERSADANDLRVRIASAVATLPSDQRDVFLMRTVQHMSFAEIASVVSAPENTVKSRMRYALERLQEALADCQELTRAEG